MSASLFDYGCDWAQHWGDKLKKGSIPVFNAKVGDTIYYLNRRCNKPDDAIHEAKVVKAPYNHNATYYIKFEVNGKVQTFGLGNTGHYETTKDDIIFLSDMVFSLDKQIIYDWFVKLYTEAIERDRQLYEAEVKRLNNFKQLNDK